MRNIIMKTDTYNLSHEFLKKNTDYEVCHFYNRTAPIILNGVTDIVNTLLSVKITKNMVIEANNSAKSNGMPFPYDLWMRVVNECNGYLPLLVQALPEGTYCPIYTPFMQIRNTKKGFGDLISWFEGVFMKCYLDSIMLYRANEMRKYLDSLVPEYGEGILWKFHSFGFRGHGTEENSEKACKAWSTRLFGTDDFQVNEFIKPDGEVIKIGSIMAQAHKIVQNFDTEDEAYFHAIDEASRLGTNIVACVIDTYSPYNFIDNLMGKVVRYAMEKGVKVVLRPDSGDTMAQAVLIYKKKVELNLTNVSVIIGDDITYENYLEKEQYLKDNGIPLDFVFYGMGAGFYKDITRDTAGFASKVSYSNGKSTMKFSADSFKQSIPGIVKIKADNNGLYATLENDKSEINDVDNLYLTYYEDGVIKYSPREREDYKSLSLYISKQKTTQERIHLAEDIKDLITELKNKNVA